SFLSVGYLEVGTRVAQVVTIIFMSVFRGKADAFSCSPTCPLMTQSGHWQCFIDNLGVGCPKEPWWAPLQTEGLPPAPAFPEPANPLSGQFAEDHTEAMRIGKG